MFKSVELLEFELLSYSNTLNRQRDREKGRRERDGDVQTGSPDSPQKLLAWTSTSTCEIIHTIFGLGTSGLGLEQKDSMEPMAILN